MQRERRRDPYPWTWELPAAVTLAALFATVVGVQVGRSIANLVAGAGWTWPETSSTPTSKAFSSPLSESFWSSLPGVLAGDSGAGLALRSSAGDELAGRALTWGTLLTTEAVVVVALGCVATYVLRRWGPGRMQGMATASEAEQLLGVTRLRKVAGIVRPDLYGKHASSPLASPALSLGASRGAGSTRGPGDSGNEAARPGSPLGRGLSGRLTARPGEPLGSRWGSRWGGRWGRGLGRRSGGSPTGGRSSDWSSPWQSVGRERRATTHDSSGEW